MPTESTYRLLFLLLFLLLFALRVYFMVKVHHSGDQPALSWCVLSFPGLLWRIPREAQMMVDAFGDKYRSYMQPGGRLFPRLIH